MGRLLIFISWNEIKLNVHIKRSGLHQMPTRQGFLLSAHTYSPISFSFSCFPKQQYQELPTGNSWKYPSKHGYYTHSQGRTLSKHCLNRLIPKTVAKQKRQITKHNLRAEKQLLRAFPIIVYSIQTKTKGYQRK